MNNVYRIRRGEGVASLQLDHVQDLPLLPDEVRIRMHAVSLNFRDLLVAKGQMGAGDVRIPASDGAGEVIQIGSAVTRFAKGDRVVPTFFPEWLEGAPDGAALSVSLGGNVDGVLAERFVAKESALVRAPESLTWAEASTLACAGVTAWHALFGIGSLREGEHILIQGTGGVSTWALQLAVAAGLRPTVLSSSDEKLQKAKALGAVHTINYAGEPAWDARVQDLTGGAHRVLDVGGADTIARSIASTRAGGTVVTIGGVAGGFALSIDPFALVGPRSVTGVVVGSRAMTEALGAFIDEHRVRPAIDRVVPFGDAASAYARLESGQPFGKVVVGISDP
ncbi:NAD(P)-dependent alcohol dehydrogenase [Lysobacter sp. 2RAF19]